MSKDECIQITVNISEGGLLPVSVLADASGLSKAVVKDAMLKGAVWLAKELPKPKPKPKPVPVANESEECEPDEPDYYGVRARALESAALEAEIEAEIPIVVEATNNEDEVVELRYSKPRRLRRIKSKLKKGDQLTLNYDPEVLGVSCPEATLIADESDYSVWYKPAGMLCQGSRWGDHTTLNRWAEKQLKPERTAFIVHRIDRMASGLVIVAHSKKTAAFLSNQFADRKVKKHYRVIVAGDVDVALPLMIDEEIEGKSARTIVNKKQSLVLRQTLSDEHLSKSNSPADADQPNHFSVLDVSIETGRKHQIRHHLASLGHPVIGDRLYCDSALLSKAVKDLDLDLQLCAIDISFTAPDEEVLRQYKITEELLAGSLGFMPLCDHLSA
ncbi:MAG: RNA pseudouridine synthase [Pseudomonadales bacterium]|nr:RNA pseudouridine synthase [Pseudomonadales bacterium]